MSWELLGMAQNNNKKSPCPIREGDTFKICSEGVILAKTEDDQNIVCGEKFIPKQK